MDRAPYPFERFIRKVHRRHLFVHLLERTSLGVLGACAAALPLLGIALWRGLPGLPFAITSLALGVCIGMLWGILTRPSTFAAAMEADRQLGWADLTSSALATGSRSADDPWVVTLRAIADAHCRSVLPSAVVLNRLGARAWGGIGLATALVIVLGLLPTYAIPTQAKDYQNSSQSRLAETEMPKSLQRDLSQSVSRRTPKQEDPDDPNASRMNDVTPPPKGSSTVNPTARDQREANASANDPNGRGSGASRSDSSPSDHLKSAQTGTQSRNAPGNGNPSGGAGESAMTRGNGSEASGQAAGANRDVSRKAPPWQSADWATQSQQALHAVDAGRIPDAYRDVVRGYFERP
jgi:hypothetical protein